MPKKNLLTVLLAAFLVFTAVQRALAGVAYDVAIDSHSNYFLWDTSAKKFTANTGVRFDLPAGTYTVTPKTLPVGQYNAWYGGIGLFLSQYTVYIDETKTYKGVPTWNEGMFAYNLPDAAAKIESTVFTLTAPGFVQFGVADTYTADNIGTMHLELKGAATASTPIPGALWLLGTGVAGLAALRKRLRA